MELVHGRPELQNDLYFWRCSKANCWDWFCFHSSSQSLHAVGWLDTELQTKTRSLSLVWTNRSA
jgi:hypothetical protein